MAESIHWLISQALLTNLAAIVSDAGATYWYTPSNAVRVNSYERIMADASRSHILALRAGEEQHAEESTGSNVTGGHVKASPEFYLLIMRREETDTGDPFDAPAVTRSRIVDRMVRDVLRALWLDVTLSGQAINIVNDSLIVDRDVDVEGPWAVAELRFTMSYSYPARTP